MQLGTNASREHATGEPGEHETGEHLSMKYMQLGKIRK